MVRLKMRVFGFTRRHLRPRLADTLLHRNVFISVGFTVLVWYVCFRSSILPGLGKIQVKDFVAGILAYSAFGFGASTAATALALSIPRNRYYYTMIVNGKGAPETIVDADGTPRRADDRTEIDPSVYGTEFRSLYGNLVFVFVWTMAAQLWMGASAVIYFAIAGDLTMVDKSATSRGAIGLCVMSVAMAYAFLQMISLIKALADYARNQETYDRLQLSSTYPSQ